MAAQLSAAWGESLWDFSNRVYCLKALERALLYLQEEYQANIDIMLWCCWLQVENIRISREALDDGLMAIDTVNQESLIKLREARRFIKASASFTEAQAKAISKQVVMAELMIEKVLIDQLQDVTCRFLAVIQDKNDPLTLSYYLDSIMIPNADQTAHQIMKACTLATQAEIHQPTR